MPLQSQRPLLHREQSSELIYLILLDTQESARHLARAGVQAVEHRGRMLVEGVQNGAIVLIQCAGHLVKPFLHPLLFCD